MAAGTCQAADLDTIVLDKSSDWVLDYAKERCSLIRTFGEGDYAVRLQIDSFGDLHELRVVAAGSALPRLPGGADMIKLQLTPDAKPRELLVQEGDAGDMRGVSFRFSFVPEKDLPGWVRLTQEERYRIFREQLVHQPAYEAGTKTMLFIFDGGRRRIELRSGSMAAPMKALRDCVGDLHRSWGLDPVQEATLSRPAMLTDRTRRAFYRAFPSGMQRRGLNAFVPVRVAVDATGKAGECVVQLDNMHEDFRKAVCDRLSADFMPALDAAGKPVASYFTVTVSFFSG